MAQFVMMAMFIQGFWFSAKLARENRIGASDVMAAFWACLIATSNLQMPMCIPQFIILVKGKFAIANLLGVVADFKPSPPVSLSSPKFSRKILPLRKIKPARCSGELALNNEQRLVCLPFPTYLVHSQECVLIPPSQRNDVHSWFVWFWQIYHCTTLTEDV
jgi:hypothetical protein